LTQGVVIMIQKTKNLKLVEINVRIGHGVAFLYGFDESKEFRKLANNEYEVINNYTGEDMNSILINEIAKFRENVLRRFQIVCELNPSSNNMLLADTFSTSEHIKNNNTLKVFINAKLPVTLCTDDDGCKVHHSHINVTSEYCNEIENENIPNAHYINMLVNYARKSAFIEIFGDLNSESNQDVTYENIDESYRKATSSELMHFFLDDLRG